MDHPEVETYEDGAGEWRWRLKGANGEIVATGESHGSREDALRAFSRAVAIGAQVVAESTHLLMGGRP